MGQKGGATPRVLNGQVPGSASGVAAQLLAWHEQQQMPLGPAVRTVALGDAVSPSTSKATRPQWHPPL
jgi:hypothetical protein